MLRIIAIFSPILRIVPNIFADRGNDFLPAQNVIVKAGLPYFFGRPPCASVPSSGPSATLRVEPGVYFNSSRQSAYARTALHLPFVREKPCWAFDAGPPMQ